MSWQIAFAPNIDGSFEAQAIDFEGGDQLVFRYAGAAALSGEPDRRAGAGRPGGDNLHAEHT